MIRNVNCENKLQVQVDKYFDKLTSRQYMTMIAIAHLHEDKTTINNIARKIGTTKQSVKQLINIIENKGYVITVPSLQDKRAVNIKITDFGKQVMVECGESGVNFFLDLFEGFSTEKMETLWSLLKKLYSFDGEEQDGFEEEVDFKTDGDIEEAQARVLKEFERRRSNSENKKR